MIPLDDRVGVVTGAAGGIGRAVAADLADAGASVVGVDHRSDPEDLPPGVDYLSVDVTRPDDLGRLYAHLCETYGRLDVIVSCAGIGNHERLHEGDPHKWQRVIDTNLMGPMRLIRALVPLALETDALVDVVVVSSVADDKPYAWGGAYAASKAGLSTVAETLRLELQPRARVTTVRPGMVDTGFFGATLGADSPRPDELGWTPLAPGEVAEIIRFALTRPRHVSLNKIVVRPTDQSF